MQLLKTRCGLLGFIALIYYPVNGDIDDEDE